MTVKTPIKDFLLEHAGGEPVSFHMPGHKGSELYRRCGHGDFLDRIFDCDITEIRGADNLFQAEGILKEAQERYAELYGVRKSYLQINGSSGANIASILTCVPKGRKLLMARNCHKSCFNALTLGGIQPVYAYPETMEEHGISGAIPPGEIERLLDENPDAEAVILPSPNYYGICSDIKHIAEIVHERNKILIVDQAHGAHLKFFSKFGIRGLPMSAEEAGADLIVNSIHKTLASLTESALLNVNSDRIDTDMLEDRLQQMESTSPSYILMASLDINASIIEEYGEQLFRSWADALDVFYSEAGSIEGLKHIEKIPEMDWTKMNFSFAEKGLPGDETEKLLMEKGIFIELFTGDLVMCMSGIGTAERDVRRLVEALREISDEQRRSDSEAAVAFAKADSRLKQPKLRAELCDIPDSKRKVKADEAEGCICAASVIPYPPGIPFICPGERISHEAIDYVKALREKGEKVIGINENGCIMVGK
ncbi:MAG: aminotransferase class I/II-fold pyridoxal phosphate-dependent enzyme [Bacillota bacterium]|nr:aminotransferase class I/II-fold pyridoxal phosphate-dependent enzyme [Bacillota bacterium]